MNFHNLITFLILNMFVLEPYNFVPAKQISEIFGNDIMVLGWQTPLRLI